MVKNISLYSLYIMGFWRSIYYLIGWDYYGSKEEWNDKQKRQKFLVCEQIKNTKDITKILKEQGEIKEDKNIEVIHNINITSNKKLKIRPDTPIPKYIPEEVPLTEIYGDNNPFYSKDKPINKIIKNKCCKKKCNKKKCKKNHNKNKINGEKVINYSL